MAKPRVRRQPPKPELVRRDGDLVTAFVNTANRQRKSLRTYADLLAWAQSAGTLTPGEAQRLERVTAERGDGGEDVVAWAEEVRALLERIVRALLARRKPATDDIVALNAGLAAIFPLRCLVPSAVGFSWAWGDRGGDDRDRMLWEVLISAADLLASKQAGRVGQCAGEGCGLFFVDRTAGSPRKWCAGNCGHRVHSRTHYQKTVKPERERRRAKYKRPLKGREAGEQG